MARYGNKGEQARLSEFECGSVIQTQDGNKGIITSRQPEDRSSGITTITFISHIGRPYTREYVWDYTNPVVTYLGKGVIKASILMEA